MKLALTGDVMLGRLVDDAVIRNRARPAAWVWGDVLPAMAKADRRLINLECVISTRGDAWRPESKAFHFRAHPRAIDVLKAAQIDCVTLANNHSLDYGPEALLECLALLDRAAIAHTGAGPTLDAASAPVVFESRGLAVAVLAVTDNEPEWEASATQPGVQYVAYDDRGLIEPYRSRLERVLRDARRRAQLVICSAHVGPNWGAPTPAMRALARDLLALGVDVYWGHSNHTPQGIELVGRKAVLHSTGDFIDDYAVDPHERNDLSFLFLLDVEPAGLRRIELAPVAIDRCRVRLARGPDSLFLERSMRAKCAAFGTAVEFTKGVGEVVVP
ncbi:CapA family protein [Candidatus Nitrospira bockiana]